MVSKVAVIALVAIIAVPIMLGYAMNLEQVTETDYRPAGDSVNVTPLLQNGVEYTDVNADSYQINSNFTSRLPNNSSGKIVPIYQSVTDVKSSIPLVEYDYGINGGGGTALSPGLYPTKYPLKTFDFIYFQSNITNFNTNYLNFTLYDLNDAPIVTVTKFISCYWQASTSSLTITHYGSSGMEIVPIYVSDPNQAIGYTPVGTYTAPGYLIRQNNVTANQYVDIAAGYHFETSTYINPSIKLPNNTKSFIMTINLDSITDANYTKLIEVYPDAGTYLARLQFIKTTTGSNISWQIKTGFNLSVTTDLYYDPNRNDNTYQLYCDLSDKRISENGNYEAVTLNYSLKYIGGWPTTIGAANPYISYDFTSGASAPVVNNFFNGLAEISIGGYSNYVGGKTPTMRMDAAIIKGYEMPIISNQIYDPKSFKTYPSTTIGNVTKYGTSITFGGNTYTVTKGNITLGTHDIPVKGLILSSIPVSGGYENKIGNTVVSTTAAPSTITFNGQWSASISTTAQEEYEYTKTEWIPGGFAWDGIDHNFLMVGLITCLGVFIALGIYGRRSGAKVLPLMLVCGAAALLFFVML